MSPLLKAAQVVSNHASVFGIGRRSIHWFFTIPSVETQVFRTFYRKVLFSGANRHSLPSFGWGWIPPLSRTMADPRLPTPP